MSDTSPHHQIGIIDTAIRLGLLALLLVWCFLILQPFIILILWGGVIAVAIYPLFLKLSDLLGGRRKLAAGLITLISLALIIVPTTLISTSAVDSLYGLAEQMDQGKLTIPPPAEKVRDWPLIGTKVHEAWSTAANNLGQTLEQYRPQIRLLGEKLLGAAAGVGSGVIQFALSLIIAGVFLASAGGSYHGLVRVARRLTGNERGKQLIDLGGATIRSVAQGVLGIALIQAAAGGLGMYLMDVPGWGLWTAVLLVLAIAQLPPIIVLAPVIAYVFGVADTTPAVLFTIWSVVVSTSDAFLKPLLLGRGMETPTLVILLGAIGGMIMSGFLGLFIGAIVLALAYELFRDWLRQGEQETPDAAAS